MVGYAFIQKNLPNLLNLSSLVFMKHLTAYMCPKERLPGRVYANVEMTASHTSSVFTGSATQLASDCQRCLRGAKARVKSIGCTCRLWGVRLLGMRHPWSAFPATQGWLDGVFWDLVSGSEAQFHIECSTRAEACHQNQKLWAQGPRCGLPACLDWLHPSVVNPTGATKNSLDFTRGEFRAHLSKKQVNKQNKHKTLLFGRTLGKENKMLTFRNL